MFRRLFTGTALALALCLPAWAADDTQPSNYVHVTNFTDTISPAPSSSAAVAITPTVSAAAESNHVICNATACNLYSVYVTTGASAGYLMTFNASAAPGDGAVTPIDCVPVPANSTASLSAGGSPPTRFGTGLTVVFSTTGCFTKTASATAFFKVLSQ